MNNLKRIVFGIAFSALITSPILMNGCSEEKVVTEEITVESTALPVVSEKDVDVSVSLEQQPQTNSETDRRTEVINVVTDKNENDRLSNDIARVNSNLQKLQSQISSANEQTRNKLNKEIQQVSLDKQKLQLQMASFDVKKKEAAVAENRQQMEKTKQEFVRLTRVRLDNYNKEMDNLRGKLGSLEIADQDDVNKQIITMDSKEEEITQKMTVLDSTIDATSFKSLRGQVDSMMSELEKSYNKLLAYKSPLS